MFETAELGRKVSKESFEEEEANLRTQLLEAQRGLRSAEATSIVVIVSGVEGARKSEVVNRLAEWLDPRGLQTHAFWEETEDERTRPPFWRFWQRMPPRKTIGIMFGSWYTRPIIQRVFDEIDDAEFDRQMGRVENHERMLAADGTVIVKLWFHLSKKAQKRRLDAIAKGAKKGKKGKGKGKGKGKERKHRAKGKKGWKLSPLVAAFSPHYDTFASVSEQAIRATDSGHAPWHIIEAGDQNYRDLTAGRALLDAIRKGLSEKKKAPSEAPTGRIDVYDAAHASILDNVDLTVTMDQEDYRRQLKEQQSRLNGLAWELHDAKRSVIAVFEGWDAGGKGGAIRRLTIAVDARLYHVVPVAAPTDEERAQHYLWRFWRHIPGPGRLRIYDRSWYGRVLVERVEGFAGEDEWRRAYREINRFEEQLVEAGMGVAKFWMHISKDEQLRRFKLREKTAWKKHKITPEDWRNREKWDGYRAAVDDMVARTSTTHAPWSLVQANDKKVARVTILKTVCDTIERTLKR